MLTNRQREALDFIAGFVAREGYGPSYDEIARGIGLASKSGVSRMIGELEERRYITRKPRSPRSIEVLRMPGDPPPPEVDPEEARRAAVRECAAYMRAALTARLPGGYRAADELARQMVEAVG